MRWMLIMQVSPEAAAAPPEEIDMATALEEMGVYNEMLQKAGVFLSADGLAGTDEGFRVDFESKPPVVTDGPFAEAKEVFNGFWILEVANREEAEHWARKCPLGPGAALEVRRIHDLADFDPAAGDGRAEEWLTKEKEWRAANG